MHPKTDWSSHIHSNTDSSPRIPYGKPGKLKPSTMYITDNETGMQENDAEQGVSVVTSDEGSSEASGDACGHVHP